MVLFHFRVHIDNIKLDKLVKFMKENAVVTLIVQEEGTRPHIHSIIEPIKTVSTYRQKFLKEFPECKGNKCYSLEEVKDIEKMKAYLCKGQKDKSEIVNVVYNKDIDIDHYWVTYWEVNKTLNKSVDRKKTIPWLHQIKNLFEQEHPQDVSAIQTLSDAWKITEYEQEHLSEAKLRLFSFMMEHLGTSVKIIDNVIIERMFKGLMNSFIQTSNIKERYNKILFNKLNLSF